MPTFLHRNRNPKTKIYELSDPNTGNVFYVGKTEHELNERLNQHISKARREPERELSAEIIRIISAGKRPAISLIEIVDSSEWEEAEIYWIEKLRQSGVRLLNVHGGGRGW